jgi:hypothetical protein
MECTTLLTGPDYREADREELQIRDYDLTPPSLQPSPRLQLSKKVSMDTVRLVVMESASVQGIAFGDPRGETWQRQH